MSHSKNDVRLMVVTAVDGTPFPEPLREDYELAVEEAWETEELLEPSDAARFTPGRALGYFTGRPGAMRTFSLDQSQITARTSRPPSERS